MSAKLQSNVHLRFWRRFLSRREICNYVTEQTPLTCGWGSEPTTSHVAFVGVGRVSAWMIPDRLAGKMKIFAQAEQPVCSFATIALDGKSCNNLSAIGKLPDKH
jgi:hypothetical protein